MFLVLIKAKEKLQKYFNLSAVKQISILTVPSGTIGAMNFKFLDFSRSFSGSAGSSVDVSI